MKKITAILLLLAMIFCLAACGKKEEPVPGPQEPVDPPHQDEPQDPPAPVDPPKPDPEPTEEDQAFWEKKFPNKTISSFQIFEGGGLQSYYFSTDIKDISAWAQSEFNWTGWHFSADSRFLLNKNETLRIADDGIWTKLSDFCIVNTEEYDPAAGTEPEDHYELGKLVVLDEHSDFQLDGLYLWGNYHDTEELFYAVEGINSQFYLNEYIDFYPQSSFDGDPDRVNIVIAHHRPLDTLLRTDFDEVWQDAAYILYYQELDEDGYMDSAYVSPEDEEGIYDIIFCCDEKPVYLMVSEFKDYNGYD